MLEFVDKQFLLDVKDQEGVMVIDADTQGAWEFGDQEQMRWAFPRAYNIYQRFCLNGFAKAGTSLLLEDSGFKIVILFTKRHRNDKVESIVKNFEAAVDDMLRKISSEVFIYSPILCRADHCFDEVLKKIYSITKATDGMAGYNWFIFNKK